MSRKKRRWNWASRTKQRLAEPSVGASPRATAAAQPRLHLAILVAVCLAVYGACLGHQFLGWDDMAHILENPLVNPPVLANLPGLWA
jgi:hypothetical protein